MRRPALWIALLPLLLIPCCWLWWSAGPGSQPGRSSLLLLALAPLLAFRLLPGLALPPATLPLLLALAWQGLVQTWSPIPEPGLMLLITRAAAFASALGLAAWLLRRPDASSLPALGLAGLGILAMGVATQGGLGLALRIGMEAPYGNANYLAHGAIPLLAGGVAYLGATAPRRAVLLCAGGLAASLLLALGVVSHDQCRAVWPLLITAVATALVLLAPARLQGRLLLGGAALLVAGWIASFTGALDPARLDHSTAQRVYMWRAACEALAGPQALLGQGPACAIAVLPEQASFHGFWLTLPTWTTHPHNEPLNVLLEGGAVLAGLLGWALWATLRPLWLGRDDPTRRALLISWAVVGCGMLFESHLHEPSGMLMLVLLAGLSWAAAPAQPNDLRLPAWLMLIPMAALLLAAGRELFGDGGAPVNINRRAMLRMEHLDAQGRIDELDSLKRRLGPLDNLDHQRALVLAQLVRPAEAIAALTSHLRRLPCDADALILAARLRKARQATPELLAAEAEARRRSAELLPQVPHTAFNRAYVEALRKVLADGGPAPAP